MRWRRGRLVAVLILAGGVAAALAVPARSTSEAAAAPQAEAVDTCSFPLPQPSKTDPRVFEARLYQFLEGYCYRQQKPAWAKDRELRNTGPFLANSSFGSNMGTHPAVRIYYSPEVVRWISNGRKGEIADGAMIVKEMYSPPASPLNEQPDPANFSAWTVMVRDKQGSWDGWYWSYHAPGGATGDAFGTEGNSDDPCARQKELSYPDSGFGQYCINCHASADNTQSTYSTRKNYDPRPGQEPDTYLIVQPTISAPAAPGFAQPAAPSPPPCEPQMAAAHASSDLHGLRADGPVTPASAAMGSSSSGSSGPNPGWEQVYGPGPSATPRKFPVETWDHVVAGPPPAGPQLFITSDQCIGCHDATQNMAAPPNMIYPAGAASSDTVYNLSPYGEWRASMMGLAGRDPVFFAQLDSEVALHADAKELGGAEGVQNLCLKCHGVMGQRQFHLDQGVQDFDKPPYFTADRVYQTDEYGALAREGISCTVCHHVAEKGLGTPETFTGNFKTGPADEIYGPYEDVVTLPMQQALGMKPMHKPQIASAELCGSCHTIRLPVLDASGKLLKYTFEQATYLEWLNSVFSQAGSPEFRTCQSCHMPQTFAEPGSPPQALAFRIASIEDDTFPQVDNRAPAKDINLKTRQPYSRHTLYGINLFVQEMIRQFWNPIGIRIKDPMATYGKPVPGLQNALDQGLAFARNETATIAVSPPRIANGALEAEVRVVNLAGHTFPSGVEFRRTFLQFDVLDAGGKTLWSSGSTSSLGVILDGPNGAALPSEFFEGTANHQAYQPHYQRITRQDQVQIYEELVRDPEGYFTTSFLSLYEKVKDNKLQPRGWSNANLVNLPGEKDELEDLAPDRLTLQDPDYNNGSGADALVYSVPLKDLKGKPASVQATLWYQSIPPYYLNQRFQQGKGSDTARLYQFTQGLNLNGTPLQNWKLQIVSASRALDGVQTAAKSK